jgi:hypothetical protein
VGKEINKYKNFRLSLAKNRSKASFENNSSTPTNPESPIYIDLTCIQELLIMKEFAEF